MTYKYPPKMIRPPMLTAYDPNDDRLYAVRGVIQYATVALHWHKGEQNREIAPSSWPKQPNDMHMWYVEAIKVLPITPLRKWITQVSPRGYPDSYDAIVEAGKPGKPRPRAMNKTTFRYSFGERGYVDVVINWISHQALSQRRFWEKARREGVLSPNPLEGFELMTDEEFAEFKKTSSNDPKFGL